MLGLGPIRKNPKRWPHAAETLYLWTSYPARLAKTSTSANRNRIVISVTSPLLVGKTAYQTDESGVESRLCRAKSSIAHKRQRPADATLPQHFVVLSCIPRSGLSRSWCGAV